MADTICDTCVRVREGLCDGEKELTACQYYKGMTNFDKYFRFTSAEKLAELLEEVANQGGGSCAPGCYDCSKRETCAEAWLDWLKREVKE